MKLATISVGDTFIAKDKDTEHDKVWIVQQNDGKVIRATRHDGRFAFFKGDEDVKPGPRPHGRRNQ